MVLKICSLKYFEQCTVCGVSNSTITLRRKGLTKFIDNLDVLAFVAFVAIAESRTFRLVFIADDHVLM